MSRKARQSNTFVERPLDRLQVWYQQRCDGEWEHRFGIRIETLDNPGWMVRIDVSHTPLWESPFERIEQHRSDEDWIVLELRPGSGGGDPNPKLRHFVGAGGVRNLDEIVEKFLGWAIATSDGSSSASAASPR
jgi:Immunity protein 53